jgi:hypothetical protein
MSGPRRRLLDTDELARYDHLALPILERVRLLRVPFLPPAVDGMTLGRWVLLRGDRIDHRRSVLIAHELVHVRQFAELGPLRFVSRYLLEYVRNLVRLRSHRAAYANISLEIEARREADRWAEVHLPAEA